MGMEKISIRTPNALCLYDGKFCSGTLDFFSRLENVPKTKEVSIVIDFSDLVFISASAAAYIFALVTSSQFYISNNIFAFKLPKDKKTKLLFERGGIVEAIKSGGGAKLDRLWDSSPFVCGGNTDISKFMSVLRERSGQEQLPVKLGAAIRETCLNIYHHAYGGPSRLVNLIWWSYFFIDRDDNGPFLSALIIDRGEGIPKKIQRTFPFYASQDDSVCIKYAMLPSVTTTKLSDRGKGSVDIKKPVKVNKLSKNDKLMIISNAGKYTYTYNDDREEEFIDELPSLLKGTLVQWKLYF